MRHLSSQQAAVDHEFNLTAGYRFPAMATFLVILGTLDVASLVSWAIRL
jgi:hypothetical protein